MDPRISTQRRGAMVLVIFMVLVIGIASVVIIATGLDWIPRLSAESDNDSGTDDGIQALGSPPAEVVPSNFLLETQESFHEIVEAVRPAVVSILAEGEEAGFHDMPFGFDDPFEYFFDTPDMFNPPHGDRGRERERIPEPREFNFPTMSSGSGFLVDAEGHILTNNHVVSAATEITIVMDNGDRYEAEIVGADPDTDVAVLKIEADEPFTYISLGDSDHIEVGDWVMAVGNPFGNLAGTVTVGIVSATNREYLDLPGGAYYQNFIQTDAAINLGNSGGPLVDIYGRAVGINTAISAQGSGIGFAIPIEMARFVYDSIIEHGDVVRGWVGVTIQNLDPGLALILGLENIQGAMVTDVLEGDPADEAGLQAQDVILKVAGERVISNATVSRMISVLPVGEPAEFVIWRDGREMTIEITPSERDPGLLIEVPEPELEENDKPPRSGPDIGLDVDDINQRIFNELRLPDESTGVIITGVDQGSTAWDKGLVSGLVITGVNNNPVSNLDEYYEQVDAAKEVWDEDGTPMMLEYLAPSSMTGSWAPLYVAIPFD